jgi:hypothetical protein
MTTVRPRLAPEAFARIVITCRVCARDLETYVVEAPADPREATLEEAAFICANKMQVHLMTEHGYPKALFYPRAKAAQTMEIPR